MEFDNKLVISAVNIIEGGAFTVLSDCLKSFSALAKKENIELVALVNSKKNLENIDSSIVYVEYPKAKKNYLFRLFYEYVYFFFLSIKLRPKYWLSLHDTTPNVISPYRYVYMHNASPFYKNENGDYMSKKFKFFVKFYKYCYKINSKKNTSIIVQQQWMRESVSRLCMVPEDKIIVAAPKTKKSSVKSEYEKNLFFFPAYPREFKNFEIICEANRILETEYRCDKNWKIILTLNGDENYYSHTIYEKYAKANRHIDFVGILPQNDIYTYYDKAECLIFPSKLETWGLPISEFKVSGKKMILADLPYSHESASGAEQVCFFKHNDAQKLANILYHVICADYSDFSKVEKLKCSGTNASNWSDLFVSIIK